jgi:hypothetical protein
MVKLKSKSFKKNDDCSSTAFAELDDKANRWISAHKNITVKDKKRICSGRGRFRRLCYCLL